MTLTAPLIPHLPRLPTKTIILPHLATYLHLYLPYFLLPLLLPLKISLFAYLSTHTNHPLTFKIMKLPPPSVIIGATIPCSLVFFMHLYLVWPLTLNPRIIIEPIDRYKARIVARGFSHILGVNFDEKFSPIVKMTTIGCLIAIATT